jgi:hypothetical protein
LLHSSQFLSIDMPATFLLPLSCQFSHPSTVTANDPP